MIWWLGQSPKWADCRTTTGRNRHSLRRVASLVGPLFVHSPALQKVIHVEEASTLALSPSGVSKSLPATAQPAAEVLNRLASDVARDAEISPENYLAESIVPFGGE